MEPVTIVAIILLLNIAVVFIILKRRLDRELRVIGELRVIDGTFDEIIDEVIDTQSRVKVLEISGLEKPKRKTKKKASKKHGKRSKKTTTTRG